MKKLKTLLALSLFCSATTIAFAQQDLVMYFMDDVPQSMYLNPARAPQSNVNIGLPALSSFYFRHQNTVFNPYHMFEQSGDNISFRTDHFLAQVRDNNYLGIEQATDLLSVGFRVQDKHYFSLAIRERFFGRLNLPGDMIRFPFTGNASFDELEDGTVDFNGLGFNMTHHREYGVGWQMDFNDKWSFGARVKYLYGMENFDTKVSNIQWQTDETTWDWTFTGEMDVYTSGIWPLADTLEDNIDLEREEITEYLLQRKNRGLGIDLGAEYAMNDKWAFSASLTDVGFITWKDYNRHILSDEGTFVYEGLAFTEEVLSADSTFSDTIDVMVEDLLDEMEAAFAYEENTANYRSSLVARAHLAATYNLYETDRTSGRAGALLQSEIYKGRLRPTATLSYQQRVGRWLTASIAYSVIDRNFRNLGAGLRLNGGPIQFYVTADNLMAGSLASVEFEDDSGTSDGIVYPSTARSPHVHLGLNLTFGRTVKDADGDGIPDKKDVCPTTPGLEEFDGCPDTDGDGIPDTQDQCPDKPGPVEFTGCPDTDGDGIPDKDDACPDVAGKPEFEGCPDQDDDGIQDSEDECPEQAGLAKFQGCPDTDGDGFPDKSDDCPEVAGLELFKGCPDTDSDGVKDGLDLCVEEPGPVENNGCPWPDTDGDGLLDKDDKCPSIAGPNENDGCPYTDSDGDGVLDKDDECVLTPGPTENNGCPVIEEEEQEVLDVAFEDLEFFSGKSTIKEESYESLESLATLLVEKTDWRLQIAGHTDDVGNDANNMKLSENRSKAVAAFLESRGVSSDRMIIKWFGETMPIGDNTTEEGRQKNRRVEFEIVFE